MCLLCNDHDMFAAIISTLSHKSAHYYPHLRHIDSPSKQTIKLTEVHYDVKLHQNVTSNFQVIHRFYPNNTKIALKVRGEGQMSPKKLITSMVRRNTYSHYQTACCREHSAVTATELLAAAGPRLWNSSGAAAPFRHHLYGLFRRQLKGHLSRKHKRGAL